MNRFERELQQKSEIYGELDTMLGLTHGMCVQRRLGFLGTAVMLFLYAFILFVSIRNYYAADLVSTFGIACSIAVGVFIGIVVGIILSFAGGNPFTEMRPPILMVYLMVTGISFVIPTLMGLYYCAHN